MVKYLVI